MTDLQLIVMMFGVYIAFELLDLWLEEREDRDL